MSAARKIAFIVALTAITAVLTAASLLAQGGSPNPSGGTCSARPAVEAGPASGSFADFVSAGVPMEFSLRGWVISQFVSRRFAPAALQAAVARNLAAVAERRTWAR